MMLSGRKILIGTTSQFATLRRGQPSLRRHAGGILPRRHLSSRVRLGFYSTTHYKQINSRDHIISLNNLQTPNRSFSKKLIIPRKAALKLTPKARETFQKLIAATNSQGIMLRYEISSQHALRMAFKFDLIKDLQELTADDEGVSLEVLEDGTPKPPSESWNDNLPKLYIHHGAFMKVLGGTLDIDLNAESGELKPKLFDREGHEMDPNA